MGPGRHELYVIVLLGPCSCGAQVVMSFHCLFYRGGQAVMSFRCLLHQDPAVLGHSHVLCSVCFTRAYTGAYAGCVPVERLRGRYPRVVTGMCVVALTTLKVEERYESSRRAWTITRI